MPNTLFNIVVRSWPNYYRVSELEKFTGLPVCLYKRVGAKKELYGDDFLLEVAE